MINVYDPLFELDKLPDAPADLATTEKDAVEYIGNTMGYTTITTCTYDLFAQLDNLYNNDCSIVIPIVNEHVSTDNKLSNVLSNNYNVSYLVITPKSGDIPVTASASPKYSCTNNDGSGIAEIPDNGVKVRRMVNFRFYRDKNDTHPIIYDALQSVFYGYKTGAETQICLDGINIFLKQQVIQFKGDEIFPFYPTDSGKYMAAKDDITPIGSDAGAEFNIEAVNSDFNKITSSTLCCHITGRFYVLGGRV